MLEFVKTRYNGYQLIPLERTKIFVGLLEAFGDRDNSPDESYKKMREKLEEIALYEESYDNDIDYHSIASSYIGIDDEHGKYYVFIKYSDAYFDENGEEVVEESGSVFYTGSFEKLLKAIKLSLKLAKAGVTEVEADKTREEAEEEEEGRYNRRHALHGNAACHTHYSDWVSDNLMIEVDKVVHPWEMTSQYNIDRKILHIVKGVDIDSILKMEF